jgi:hypothetical protein
MANVPSRRSDSEAVAILWFGQGFYRHLTILKILTKVHLHIYTCIYVYVNKAGQPKGHSNDFRSPRKVVVWNRPFAPPTRLNGKQPPDVTAEILPRLEAIKATLPEGYRIDTGGSGEESDKANVALAAVFPLMLIVTLTVIMLQVRSFLTLFTVFLTAPLGLVGALLTLLVLHQPFGFNAILGLIGLAGILMRNTLILVDQIQTHRRNGLSNYDAIVDPTVRRARPVILTAVAAMLAFIPLTQSTFWGALAYVLIGGVGVGTLHTLLFLPALYAIWFRVKKDRGAEPIPETASMSELGSRRGLFPSRIHADQCCGREDVWPKVRAASIPLSRICFERAGLGSARASCRAPIITAKIPIAVRLLVVASPLGTCAPISSRRWSNLPIKARRVEAGCRAISAISAAAAQPLSGLSRRPGVR